MKKFLFCATAAAVIAGITGPAMAADMQVKARPLPLPPPPIYSWTGCYLGANAGWVRSNVDVNWAVDRTGFAVPGPLIETASGANISRSGGTAGGQVGCNWQTGQWVWGVEGDFNWASMHGHRDIDVNTVVSQTPVLDTLSEDDGLRNFGTLRGRLGLAAGSMGNWLFYVTGGVAWASFKLFDCINATVALPACNTALGNTAFADGTRTRWGGTVGLGLETLLTQAWSLKVEYLYMGFGSASTHVNFVTPVLAGEDVTFNHSHLNVQTVRFGLNYHFGNYGTSAPVYTRY
jgi:outer membrane immunogenic protein